ncbi:30S ribosomal protein S2 [Candidatus Pacearchaeota archaeon]|nr:MAG: 30S ribosomal protein S2 [Candidatus Pacearchaeota archaeon]
MPRKKADEGVKEKKASAKSEEKTAKKTDARATTQAKASKPSTSKKTAAGSKKSKLEELKAKAKELEKKLEKEKRAPKVAEELETLVPAEDYLKSSVHLGTRAITPDMKKYVYKRRADGLAVFDIVKVDQMLREAGEYLAQFSPEQVVVVCKREAGERALKLFSKVTGIKAFIRKYPPGILTNPNLENFIEADLVVICDPWTDTNALDDAKRIGVPVMAVCDANNYTMNISKVIVGNNKSPKSLGMIFYLLAKLYVEKRGMVREVPPISEWIENWENLIPPK